MRYADCHPDRKYFARGLCKKCYFVAYGKAYHAAHREEIAAKARIRYIASRDERIAKSTAYRAAHVEGRKAYDKARRLACPELAIAYNLRKHGCSSSLEDIKEVARRTECEVDGRPAVGLGGNTDHDHHNGRKVRGRLCRACNLALGDVDDSPERLRALADYIEKYRELHR